jgi:5-methylcytosine-specific restriction endonuclease McrA
MPMRTKEEQLAYQRQWLANRRAKGIELLGGACARCQSTEGLEFDHVDPSTKWKHNFWSYSWAKILKELDKCQLLCEDCHKEKTSQSRWDNRKACDKHRLGKRKCTCN